MSETAHGLVVHPGDTLIVCVGERCTIEKAIDVKSALEVALPWLADIIVIAATQIAVYQPDVADDWVNPKTGHGADCGCISCHLATGS